MSYQRQLSQVSAESDAQMAMFDQLGPRARDALNYWPREPNVRTFVRQFKMQWVRARLMQHINDGCVPDPAFDDPAFDAEFAAYIEKQYKALTGTVVPCLRPRKLQRPIYRARSQRIRLNGERLLT